MNGQIRARDVRLIDFDGTQLGIKSVGEAANLAQQRGMDLIEIAPSAMPPVCKILDYTKFRYEREKRLKEARKKQKAGHLKEIRIRPKIGEHDFSIKLEHIRQFLSLKDKVRVTVMFRGREVEHAELGMRLIQRAKDALAASASVEQDARLEGNRLTLLLTPKK